MFFFHAHRYVGSLFISSHILNVSTHVGLIHTYIIIQCGGKAKAEGSRGGVVVPAFLVSGSGLAFRWGGGGRIGWVWQSWFLRGRNNKPTGFLWLGIGGTAVCAGECNVLYTITRWMVED